MTCDNSPEKQPGTENNLTASQQKPWRYAETLLAVISVGLIQLKVLWRIWDLLDIPVGDEAAYLYRGYLFLAHGQLPSLQASPLMSMIYAGLLRVLGSATTVTLLSRVILAVCISALIFLVLRRLAPIPVALGLTFWWCINWINVIEEVLVYRVALVIGLLGILAVPPKGRYRWLPLCMAFCLILFLRLEYALSLVLLGFLLIGKKLLATHPLRTLWLKIAVGCALILAIGVGLVFWIDGDGTCTQQSSSKLFVYFGQAYEEWYTQKNPELGPLNYHNWLERMAEQFGGSCSVLGAAQSNPKEFLAFITSNLLHFPLIVARAVYGHISFLPPGISERVPLVGGQLSTVVLGLGLVASTIYGIRLLKKDGSDAVLQSLKSRVAFTENQSDVMIGLLALCGGCLPAILFALRWHYLPPIIILSLSLLALGIGMVFIRRSSPIFNIAMMIVLIVLAPQLRNRIDIPGPHAGVVAVKALQQIMTTSSDDLRLLADVSAGLCVHSNPERCTPVYMFQKSDMETVEEFIHKWDVNAVYVTPTLTGSYLYRDDPYFEALIAGKLDEWRLYVLDEGSRLFILENP
ncbi:MAG TPA: hypothetical protein PKZ84_02280 [Anaerolineae bacterium]|nr:hypothetical protein [Anaerolineae bacterium]HQI83595.1 hypothetical protein [Anaerolineae bacterium]